MSRRLATMVLPFALLGGACATTPSDVRAVVAPAHVQGGEWFAQTGCTSCHSIAVYGIHNLASTGPDLSLAVEDVQKRFGRPLEDFLAAPTGTMAMVLSSRIPLTPEQRGLTIDRLREAYRLYQEKNGTLAPAASH